MTAIRKNTTPCGPAIACGAACVSLDHKPGEPTSIDNAFAAIKRFFTHKPATTDSAASTSTATDLHASSSTTAQGHAI